MDKAKTLLPMVLLLACAAAPGQSGGAPGGNGSGQNDNPFPGTSQAAPALARNQTGQQPASASPAPSSAASPANASTDNPFPGEDPNAPIIPTGPGGAGGANAGSASAAAAADVPAPTVKDIDPDGDPVRTPDWNNVPSGNGMPDSGSDDGFSSSRTGLSPITGDDNASGPKGKQDAPEKTPAQVLKEDLDVGSFYLDQHNWSAAQSRFQEAFRLNPEEPKAVWGLAQSEEHLDMFAKAREHYELFLSYGADGRQAKEARKALKEMPESGVKDASAGGPH